MSKVDTNSIGGAAGSANLQSESNGIINDDKSGVAKDYINVEMKDTVAKNIINPVEAPAKNALLQTVGGIILSGGSDADVSSSSRSMQDKTVKVSSRYGVKATRYSAKAATSLLKGRGKASRYIRQLREDIKDGKLTGKQSTKKILKDSGKGVTTGVASMGKILSDETKSAIKNFEGSEEFEGIAKTKNALSGTKRTLKTVKTSAKAVKKTAKFAKKAGGKAIQATKYAAKASGKILTKLLTTKGGLIALAGVGVAVIIISIVAAVASIVPNITLKSDDVELSKTYAYVTKLDAEFTKKVREYKDKKPGYDRYHFKANNGEWNNITIKTDGDAILSYFDSKFGDYAFDSIIHGLFGGKNIKSELEQIHSSLYSVSTKEWSETVGDDTEDDSDDKVLKHLDINVTITTFDEYLNEHKEKYLTSEDDAKMSVLKNVGIYTTKIELGDPFGKEGYSVSSRYGWRITDDNKLEEHNGIDIAIAAGTTVKTVIDGEVTKAEDSTIVVKQGEREVTYKHVGDFKVSKGQKLKFGAAIGTVIASSENSTPCLHLEYKKKGDFLNPQFFMKGGGYSYGSALGDGSFEALIAEAEKYLGYPYVFGGSNPSTSFDCSGFVCWVFTHSGVRNLPRTNAQGIYDQCTPIDEKDARPGDLVFFYNTYDCPRPITHVGIYVGEGRMINAGDPIQYDNFHSNYWKKYNPVLGRLK